MFGKLGKWLGMASAMSASGASVNAALETGSEYYQKFQSRSEANKWKKARRRAKNAKVARKRNRGK